MTCELNVQVKDYTDQILGTNLLQNLPGGIFNFSIHFSAIFPREFSVTIREKYTEKLKTLSRGFYPRLVPKKLLCIIIYPVPSVCNL